MIIKIKCNFTDGPNAYLLFATQNIQDGGNWENRVIGISSLSRNIGEDKSYEVSGITIQFNDTDRYFRDIMSGPNRYIAGKVVELYTDTNQLIYTGTVEKWKFTEDAFELSINDRLSGLDILIPQTIEEETYPNGAEEADGQAIPVIYGTLYGEKGAVKCWRVDDNLYLAARHRCFQLMENGIGEKEVFIEDGTLVAGAVLDNDRPDGRAYIQAVSTADFLYANIKGKMDGSGNLIEEPIDALKDLLTDYTGMTYNADAAAKAQALMQNRGYSIAAVIGEQKNLNDVLVDFCFSFDCDFLIGKGNEIVITMINRVALVPIRSFTPHQIIDFQMEEMPDEIRNKVKYSYKYDFGREKYTKVPVYSKSSSIANWGEFYNRNESLDLLYVAEYETAFDVVQRYVILRKNPKRTAQVEIPLSEFAGVDIADIIEIQHPGAVDIGPRKYQVRRVNVDFDTDVVQVEAMDITSLTGGMLILGDFVGNEKKMPLTWTGTSEGNFHRDYAYLADGDTGYFSNGTDYGKVLY